MGSSEAQVAEGRYCFLSDTWFLTGELTTHKNPRAPSSEISGVG